MDRQTKKAIVGMARERTDILDTSILPTIQTFVYGNFNIRTVIRDDEPYFVVRDLCDVLEIKNSAMAVSRLDEDEVSLTDVTDDMGRIQEMMIVNEPGMYSLTLGSRKPEAKAFKRWVTHDVLPTIRKTGRYEVARPEPVKVLSPSEALSTVLRTTADLVDEQTKMRNEIEEVKGRLDKEITLDSAMQRKLQKAIATSAYAATEDELTRRKYFGQIHREIRNRWGVASYRDVKKVDLDGALAYVKAWRPLCEGVFQ